MAHKRKPYVYIGTKVRFSLDQLVGAGTDDRRSTYIRGVVTYVNRAHRWFLVDVCGLRTCFFFSDIGEGVYVIGA